MPPFGVVILAAGGSSRLGRPKQLVPFRGTTLVGHAAQTALDSGAAQVITVLGASADLVRAALTDLPVEVVENQDWRSGMGGSIGVGLGLLKPDIEACILMLVDQPAVTAEHLQSLVTRREELAAPFVVTSFQSGIGPPAVFHRSLFAELVSIKGDQGARAVLRKYDHHPSIVLEAAALDVDTEADVAALERLTSESAPRPSE